MLESTELQANGQRPKLLIVDDQQINIRILHELFRDEFEIFMTLDSSSVVAKAKELAPHLVLLDIEMPGINGYQVCQLLKADPGTADIPVIFITAHFSEADEVRGFEVGAVDFIHKPINKVITQARVRNHINAKLQADRLRQIALVDGLTGVANRRKLDQELQQAWGHCTREQVPLSLFMIDVDCFKHFNDTYGHQAGDGCLQAIAATLRKTLRRSYDIVARYGGEEFACILPNTDAAGALLLARRIRERVRELAIEHQASKVAEVVTVSVGAVTVIPTPDANSDELLMQADKMLYEAKVQGRDRVCCRELNSRARVI
ncbi:diguanylate cyclase [Halioxenophilus sp. WMMB6]|uniref:diguanylate cyclase n=1 Tax=Halioxenophilus sp. WMMB6 TaxID=3073815 RepID=UPI00295ECB6A|nr:diguanylate cyclase [Halioxenophilus sp. WMMB6]